LAWAKIRWSGGDRSRRFGGRRGKKLFNLSNVAVLGLLSALRLIELGHKGDKEGVFKLLVIENGTVAEAMFFSWTKEAVTTRRGGISGRSLDTMDKIVHIVIVGIVRRIVRGGSSKNLSHIAIVGILVELGVGRNVGVLVLLKLGRAIRVGEVVAESNLQHARAEKSIFGRITAVKAGDTKEIGRMMTTVNEEVNHVSGRQVFGTTEENSAEADDFGKLIGEVKKSLRGFLFRPVTTETDGRVNIARMTVVEDVDESEVSICIGAGTVVVFGVEGKTSGLLYDTRDIILPMEVFGVLGRGKIDTKGKAIGTTVDFVEQFIGNDMIATGESVVGEGSVPDTKTGSIVGRAGRGLASEAFMVAVTFKDGTITENDSRTNDTRVGVVVMLRSISPGKRGEIFSSKDLVRVLVIVIALFHGGREGVVVENVRG
jgi:hypothetical protein